MAHTPGPWAEYRRTESYIYIGTLAYNAIAGGVPTAKPGEVALQPVCRVEQDMHAKDNAKLIAAAPDLLRLLRQLHDMCNGYVKGHRDEYLASKSEAHELLNRLGG